jgi:uncharacterized membrane protein YtjA (UPF0391 family)
VQLFQALRNADEFCPAAASRAQDGECLRTLLAGPLPTFPSPAGTKLLTRHWTAERNTIMTLLKWALIFLVISLIAALFGFTGIAAASADIARVLFYIFIVIFVVLLILALTIFRA